MPERLNARRSAHPSPRAGKLFRIFRVNSIKVHAMIAHIGLAQAKHIKLQASNFFNPREISVFTRPAAEDGLIGAQEGQQ
jgi:hypothetical protein